MMLRKRRFSVDYIDAMDLLIQAGMTRDKIAEQLGPKTYFSIERPDLIDRIMALATYPYLYIRHVFYKLRTKRAAAKNQ